MAVPRVPIRSLAPGEQLLSSEAEAHLVRVLRLRDGDGFIAFDPAFGFEARGEILRVKKGATRVLVGELAAAPETRKIAWVHGLAKGEKCDAIVRQATELGATLILFAKSARSVPAGGRALRWQKIADEAARQSGRARSPEVRAEPTWDDALLAARAAAGEESARFCLWESATEPLGPLLVAARERALVFAAGPEGGLEREEAVAAVALGYTLVSIGERILRTETVPAAVLGAALIL